LFWALIGAGVLWAALRCDYRWLEKAVVPALLVAVVLLVLVLVPPIGQAINGTRRWIRLGPVSFQPVELAKLALVLYLAAFLAKKRGELEDFRTGVLPPLLVAGLLAGLVLVQPDLGNCMTLIALTFGLLYLAGSPVKHLAWVAAPALPLIVLAVWMAPYRMLRIALRAPDAFGAYLALGITVLLATQTLVNLGVVTGLLPTKGLPLPFISFGGSALLMTMLGTGMLLNISQHAHV